MWSPLLLFVVPFGVCVAQSPHASRSPHASSVSVIDKSSSEMVTSLYNICPVVNKFLDEYDHRSAEEIKADAADDAMMSYMINHPNNTLWDFFKIEVKQKSKMARMLPFHTRVADAVKDVVDFSLDSVIYLAHSIADAVTWVANSIREPSVGAKEVKDFFTEFSENIKLVWRLMKEDPKDTSENLAGGLLLHIMHHPAEFTAETVLLVATGFAVIGGLIFSVETIFGALSSSVTSVLMSVLVFLHIIDDPLLIVTPLITSIVNSASALNSNGSVADNTSLTIDRIQPLQTCQIPKEFRPIFSSRDICLSTPIQVRYLIFGTSKRTFEMSYEERTAAYNRFHDFACCFLGNEEYEVTTPMLDKETLKSNLVSTPVKIQNCSQLLSQYDASTVWRSDVPDRPEPQDYRSVVGKVKVNQDRSDY
ncbi:hypothetical protein CCR75_005411 [Bremia lactucae]|uniref:Uncharacterized protein n=1 Tax=Bremia lactucae TaxID=4779 RepID=A0A976FK24_BRELC|nr:hypothetical protein CCR75_005411 [Bremia lactucae]